MAAFLNFNAFLDAEHTDASTLAAPPGLLTTPGNWFIFGTKYETLGRDAPGAGAVALADTNMIIKDFGAAPLLVAVAAKLPGTWGGFNNTVTAAGLLAKPIFPEYGNLSITDTIQSVRMHTTAALTTIDGRSDSLVNVIVGNNMPAAAGVVYPRLAQLALPDVVANEAARDLIAAISKPTFDKQVTIYLNQRSICCKTFYDFICKITDIIYDKKRINIWYERALVVNAGVKVGSVGDLKCDGVALTCKNGLSTAKHSVFTEELSYMYSEVVRLITNHHNMLNSGFAPGALANLAAVTPLETALNKFKNFLAVLLRYDYLIRGDTNSRKERFRVQAADALLNGVRYMADGAGGAGDFGFENYLYNNVAAAAPPGAPPANGLGCLDFFANYAAATPLSFFTAVQTTKIHEFMTDRGAIPDNNMTAIIAAPAVFAGLLQGIAFPGCKTYNPVATAPPGALNAGGTVGTNNTYSDFFGDSILTPGGHPFGAVPGQGELTRYNADMSIVGTPSDIHMTCARIADPHGRYGITPAAVNALGVLNTLNPAAKGLTYKQFMALLLMQLIAGYDNIVIQDVNGGAIRAAGAGDPYPIVADSLLARTYYMSDLPSLFRSAAANRQLVAQPDATLIAFGATPISQSIVRWIEKCLD